MVALLSRARALARAARGLRNAAPSATMWHVPEGAGERRISLGSLAVGFGGVALNSIAVLRLAAPKPALQSPSARQALTGTPRRPTVTGLRASFVAIRVPASPTPLFASHLAARFATAMLLDTGNPRAVRRWGVGIRGESSSKAGESHGRSI